MDIIMTILRVVFVLLVCFPIGYLLLYLSMKLIDYLNIAKKKAALEADAKKRNKDGRQKKRSVYYNGRS